MNIWHEAYAIWKSGGWLMLPLLALAIFIYYVSLDLLVHLQYHFILRKKVYKWSDQEMDKALDGELKVMKSLLLENPSSTHEIRTHYSAVRNEYIPFVNRRIRFLAIIITTGPLLGLLGTVTGMLSTFDGMLLADGNKFNNIVKGISEALITTQTGLIISIPAMIILSLIIQKRNRLVRSIVKLEKYNLRKMLIKNA